jgi:hypothetical protein
MHAMTTLPWREVAELRLTSKLIPNPNSQAELLHRLDHIRVAVDGPLLHIDPRSIVNGQKRDDSQEYDVFVVPAASVELIRYREVPQGPGVRVLS